MQESDCDDNPRVAIKPLAKALVDPEETTGSKCKTLNSRNKPCKLTQNTNNEQNLIANIEHSIENCQVSSLQMNLSPSERCPSHSAEVEIAETVMKQREAELHNVTVCVKYLKEKHKVELCLPCTGVQAVEHFSRILHIPVERLKLIHKGQLQTELTIVENLKPNSVFLAFGEMAESEDGLEAEDIELIMKQLSVERNVAIKALRKTNCLVDAIFEIGNEM